MTYPAFIANALGTLATDTYANYVGRRVEEWLDHLLELSVSHRLGEAVDGHSGDE